MASTELLLRLGAFVALLMVISLALVAFNLVAATAMIEDATSPYGPENDRTHYSFGFYYFLHVFTAAVFMVSESKLLRLRLSFLLNSDACPSFAFIRLHFNSWDFCVSK